MIRALYRTRLGRYVEVVAEFASELVSHELRRRLGIVDVERRVRALEVYMAPEQKRRAA